MTTITIPLSQFLECLWGYRDKAYVEESIANIIRLADDSNLTYIEPVEKTEPNIKIVSITPSGRIFTVWRRKDYETTLAKNLADKAKAELRLLEHNKYKALRTKISDVFQEEMHLTDSTMATQVAEKLLQSHTKESLIAKIKEMLNVDVEIDEKEL